MSARVRCNICRRLRTRSQMTRNGKPRKTICNTCTNKRSRIYGVGHTVQEKIDAIAREYPRRDPAPAADGPRVLFKLKSTNKKLGPIPMSISEPGTCPPSCAMYSVGCYASYGWNGTVWRKTRSLGLSWAAFLRAVAGLPAGQLWRHNEAGDLAGEGERVDVIALLDLAWASHHTRGFTYTHKHTLLARSSALKSALVFARSCGFTVNLSADSLTQADELADLHIAPVVITLPQDAESQWLERHPRSYRTPEGRKVVVCPAQTNEGMTCARCRLCAVPNRKSIVGFLAHGQGAALVSELVREKRQST